MKSWIERIPELVRGYKLEDIWNMDELGLFFKLLPDKGMTEKAKSKKGGKKAKVCLTVTFFVNADGQKVDEPVIIWKSKKPRCFKNLKGRDLSRTLGVHYFATDKAWMNSEIMSDVLKRLDRKMKMQSRNVVLFIDNTTSHRESIEKNFSNIKLVFLPKNTTSRLQPLDAGIIRAFKLKYRKFLIRYVILRVDDNKRTSDIINEIDNLKVISWVKSAWREVTSDTIKHCFEKFGFPTDDYVATAQDSEEEFEMLFNEISENYSIDKYVEVDNTLATSKEVDVSKIDWREKLRNECIQEVLNMETTNSDLEYEDEDKSQESSSSSIITPKKALLLFDKAHLFATYNENNDLQRRIDDIITTIEGISIRARKQASITAFFH